MCAHVVNFRFEVDLALICHSWLANRPVPYQTAAVRQEVVGMSVCTQGHLLSDGETCAKHLTFTTRTYVCVVG